MPSHRLVAALLIALAAGWLGGCPGDDDDDDTAPCPEEGDADCTNAHAEPLQLEVGTGSPEDATFAALPADGSANLFPGPQGGYHVYLQVRARGLCPNRVVYERKLREPGGTQVIRSQVEKVPLVDGGDGWWVLPRSQPTFVCPSTEQGVAVADRDLDLEVSLTEELKPCDQGNPGLADAPRTLTRHITLRPICAGSDTVCQQSTDIGCAAPP